MYPRWAWYAEGSNTTACTGVDRVAISNRRGEFVLTSEKPLKSLDLLIEAAGLATRNCLKVAPGEQVTELKLESGVTVRGRFTQAGQVVAGVAVGLAQVDRTIDKFVGEYTIGTDSEGRFTFNNVAPNFEYWVYGKMDSLKKIGAVAAQKLKVGESGSVADAGTLEVKPGHRVRGRVVLSDGEKVPAQTRILLGRENAWDSQLAELDEQGRFELIGVPSETVSISVHLKAYRLSGRNISLDRLNPFRLSGRVDGDVDALVVLLEPGEMLPSESGRDGGSQRDQPLRGAPADATGGP